MLAIELLEPKKHDRVAFLCGEVSLDQYLRERATQHHRDGIATTHVLVDTDVPTCILGFYSLSAAQLQLEDLQDIDRRRLPRYPIPAVRMGRLAVAQSEQRKGYGDFLLGHAVARCLTLRETLGVRVLIVDALHEQAAAYYRAYGFRHAVASPRTLYLSLGKP